jgi:ribosomal protein S18 acetylase RimI-like enzyme
MNAEPQNDWQSQLRAARPSDRPWLLRLFEHEQKGQLGALCFPWIKYLKGEFAGKWEVLPEIAFIRWERKDGLTRVHEIAVAAAAKGKGIGRWLMSRLPLPISLETDARNEAAQKFYTRLGFSKVGERTTRRGKLLFILAKQ